MSISRPPASFLPRSVLSSIHQSPLVAPVSLISRSDGTLREKIQAGEPTVTDGQAEDQSGSWRRRGRVRPATGLLALLLGAIFSLLVPAPAVAQEQWLSPTLGGYAFDWFYFEA